MCCVSISIYIHTRLQRRFSIFFSVREGGINTNSYTSWKLAGIWPVGGSVWSGIKTYLCWSYSEPCCSYSGTSSACICYLGDAPWCLPWLSSATTSFICQCQHQRIGRYHHNFHLFVFAAIIGGWPMLSTIVLILMWWLKGVCSVAYLTVVYTQTKAYIICRYWN